MIAHRFQNYIVKIFNDPTFSVKSTDRNHSYRRCYFSKDAYEYPTSKHGIKVFQNDIEINSCLIIGHGGATGINKNSTLVDDENLLICCCDSIFSLRIETLELRWLVQADTATCFQIFKLEDDYVIHGETEITRIDSNGNIKWNFGGADIFVNINGETEFILHEDHIQLIDFGNRRYKINFNGNELCC
ncbi:hypothetical protein [Mucilaginibacter paludis]|uniref:Uncharacterized protein n=1 Tax=Mucilaginibacter paludis DSM 18603 TaxID=714943 RepID=H1Y0C1_9SPHI|nr:hypothetical protein [Mucilaginibacter paludis]EHQ28170.1 hypothetical protein Mucpa_4079 [Mucilaginibacter paludis DSM 18603]